MIRRGMRRGIPADFRNETEFESELCCVREKEQGQRDSLKLDEPQGRRQIAN